MTPFKDLLTEEIINILEEYNISYSHEDNSFIGTIYSSGDLIVIDNIFYSLGITYTCEGDYGKGVYIKSTGVVEDDNI